MRSPVSVTIALVLGPRLPQGLKPTAAAVVLGLGLGLVPAVASAATSGANGTHDPSRMIESDGKFYVFSTGGGSKSSPDGLVWTAGPGIFAGGAIPQSTTSIVSSNEGVWAPDLLYLNGQYYLYYSIANAQNACAVGLVTSPTLNPSSASYKWTDRGLVVSNTGSETYCTIDPAPVLDATGNLWLAWGSGYSHPSTSNTIWVTRLDNTTGLASSSDTAKPGHPLEQGHIEASYLYYRSPYYYLFWNSGGCCSGTASTYTIHMARSQTIIGPYSGSTVFYSSTGTVHGPGQIGIYDKCGASRFTYHYYPSNGSVLGENELTWSTDGWPVVGPESTTPLTPCGQAGGSGGTGAGGTSAGGASGSGPAAPAGGVSGNPISGGAPNGGSAGEQVAAGGSVSSGGSVAIGPAGGGPGSAGASVVATGGAFVGSGGSSSNTNTNASPAASPGGCTCSAVGGHGSHRWANAALLLGLTLGARRRRGERRTWGLQRATAGKSS